MSLSERIFSWIVRLYLGAWLSITLYLFTLTLLIYFSTNRHSMASDWLPFLFFICFLLAISCGLFAFWQRRRLPKKCYLIVRDTLLSAFGLVCVSMLVYAWNYGIVGVKHVLFRQHELTWGSTGQRILVQRPSWFALAGNGVTVSLTDESGRTLSSTQFSLGWAVSCLDVNVGNFRDHLLLQLFDSNNRVQFYAFFANKPVLVRLQKDGQLLRQIYEAGDQTVGPDTPERTPEEWEASLSSSDFAEIMQTLVWLGGVHLDPDQPAPEYRHESLEQGRIVKETRLRPGVKKMLQRIASSEDPWIREAAELASKPE